MRGSVADTHHVYEDPYPACHFDADADPDPAYQVYPDPDPTFNLMRIHADPDPQHWYKVRTVASNY